MQKGKRSREPRLKIGKVWVRLFFYRKEIASALNALQLIQLIAKSSHAEAEWWTNTLNLGQSDSATWKKMMNSVLGRGIFICHHSFFTETKERETRFCEGLFSSFVKEQGEAATQLWNCCWAKTNLAGEHLLCIAKASEHLSLGRWQLNCLSWPCPLIAVPALSVCRLTLATNLSC